MGVQSGSFPRVRYFEHFLKVCVCARGCGGGWGVGCLSCLSICCPHGNIYILYYFFESNIVTIFCYSFKVLYISCFGAKSKNSFTVGYRVDIWENPTSYKISNFDIFLTYSCLLTTFIKICQFLTLLDPFF